MGNVIFYIKKLKEAEAEITEWNVELRELGKELGLGDDPELDKVMEELELDELRYYMRVIERAELLHQWKDTDNKYGAYRRRERLCV